LNPAFGSNWFRWRWLVVLCLAVSLPLFFVNRKTPKADPAPVRNNPYPEAKLLPLGAFVAPPAAGAAPPRPMKVGIDVDNWSGQTQSATFEQSLVAMKVDFLSWHIQPGEETPEHLNDIVNFCHKHNWGYLFNTEVGNYALDTATFKHSDGTYRYDVADSTLQLLKDDPLFLGVIYDEIDLMQGLNGSTGTNGKALPPYLVETKSMSPGAAFDAVTAKVKEMQQRYQSYGKRLIFEMTFPDYPFAFARGGALLAPKLLKETYNDLMYSVYRGAALEYNSSELWGCADLWFLDRFPTAGQGGPGYHTPAELSDALRFANAAGYDYVYIEMSKGLMDTNWNLTDYGRAVIAFQQIRATLPRGDWRTAPVQYYVKRFPDGYWGEAYSTFIPDHPYGSWLPNPYRDADKKWFALLQSLSHGTIPSDANNWNALNSPFFKNRPYSSMGGLPLMVVYDHYGTLPKVKGATNVDLCVNNGCPAVKK
jgi:hypothetical protein